MRPHVELIDQADYVWHGAELIKGNGRASEC
jgi:ribose 5-phosphate isomerase